MQSGRNEGHEAFEAIMPRVTIIIFCLLAFLGHARADFASDAYAKGGFAEEARVLKSLAEQGQAIAQCKLGGLYQLGQGVPQDYSHAIYWWRKAADQGNVGAQTQLGIFYTLGSGAPQAYDLAVYWFRKAAAQGNATAKAAPEKLLSQPPGVRQIFFIQTSSSDCDIP